MPGLGCLWARPRLERLVDGALSKPAIRRTRSHLGHCRECSARVDQLQRLRALVRNAAGVPGEPTWDGFWNGVQARIQRETPHPIKDPWWLPFWRPFWGHPRLALSGAVAAGLALVLSLWPVDDDGSLNSAWATPVVVQDVSSEYPEQSVMVYSSQDRTLTVIWLFTASTQVQ